MTQPIATDTLDTHRITLVPESLPSAFRSSNRQSFRCDRAARARKPDPGEQGPPLSARDPDSG